MAKITSGILGGFRGKLSTVQGYRRNGKNIIQAPTIHINKSLSAWMQTRNEFKYRLNSIIWAQTSANRNTFFFQQNSIKSLPNRIDAFLRSWPKEDYEGQTFESVLASKFEAPENYYNITLQPVFSSSGYNWHSLALPVNLSGNIPHMRLIINLRTWQYTVNRINRVGNQSSQNVNIGGISPGTHFVSFCASATSMIQNPTNSTAHPVQWIIQP